MRKVELAFAIASAVNLAVVFIVTFAQVIQRYFFHMSIPWATDVIRITFVYSIFCGMCVSVIRKSHLNIDVFVQMMPEKVKFVLMLVSNVMILIFIGVVFRYSITFVAANTDQFTPFLAYPMSWVYAIFPIVSFVMLISVFIDICRLFSRKKNTLDAVGER